MNYFSNYFFTEFSLGISAGAGCRSEYFARIALNLFSQFLRSVAVDAGDETFYLSSYFGLA
jgi:hypothetical protein